MGIKPPNPLHFGVDAAEARLQREFEKAAQSTAFGRFAAAIGCLQTAFEISQALVDHYKAREDIGKEKLLIPGVKRSLYFEAKCEESVRWIEELRFQRAECERAQKVEYFNGLMKHMEANGIYCQESLDVDHFERIRGFVVESILVKMGFCLWPGDVQASRREPSPKIADFLRALPGKIAKGDRSLEAKITGIYRCCDLTSLDVAWAVKLRIQTPWGVEKGVGLLLPPI